MSKPNTIKEKKYPGGGVRKTLFPGASKSISLLFSFQTEWEYSKKGNLHWNKVRIKGSRKVENKMERIGNIFSVINIHTQVCLLHYLTFFWFFLMSAYLIEYNVFVLQWGPTSKREYNRK